MPDQLIQFALAQGLDTRADAHSQELGALDQAVNCVFDKLGAVRKRPGNLPQGNIVVPGNACPNPVQIGTLPLAPTGLMARGGEQIILGGNRLFSRSPSAADHASKDQIQEAVGTRRPVHGSQGYPFGALGNLGFYNADVCQTSDGFRVFAWTATKTNGDVYFSVHDTTSPTLTQVFASNGPVTGSLPGPPAQANRVTLIAVGTAVVLMFYDDSTGKLYATTIVHGVSGWSYGPTTQIFSSGVTGSNPPPPLDAVTDDGVHVIIAMIGAGATGLQVARFLPDLLGTGTYTATFSNNYTTDESITTAIAMVMNAGKVWVVWANSTNLPVNWRMLILTGSSGATITSSRATIGVGDVTDALYLGLVVLDSNHVRVITNDETQNGLGATRMDNNGIVDQKSATYGVPLIQPITRPFAFGSKNYLLGWIPSTLQGSYAWVDLNAENSVSGVGPAGVNTGNSGPRVVALIAPRLASAGGVINGVRQYGTTSHVISISATLFAAPIGVVSGGSLPGSPQTPGLWETRLDFAHPNIGRSAVLGRQLITAQGVYDGTQQSEFGFTTYPEGYTGAGAGGGALTPGATYQYAILWEWQTDAGELVQSTTQASRGGQVLTVTLTGGQNAVTLTLTGGGGGGVQPLLTCKSDVENAYATMPVLAIYRALAGGSFTRVTGLRPTGNLYPTSYADVASDTSIAGNAQLYFSPGQPGSPLDNVSPPSFSHTITAFGRIWGIGDDLRTIWPSQSYVEGFQPGFNEALTFQVEDGGDLVALGPLNQNLVILTSTRIYMIYGQGPDNTGGGTPWPPPQLVQSDVGCIDPRSVVGIPDGLIFLSSQGLCIVGQDFSVTYLDAPEDILRTYPTVRSAVLFPERHEVRFALDNGTNGVILTLNYWAPQSAYKYRWSTFQIFDQVAGSPAGANTIVSAAGYVNGSYCWSSVAGNPYSEDNTGSVYFDGTAAPSPVPPPPPGTTPWVSMLVVTGWIPVNGIVGYQRGKKTAIIGDWYTSHDLLLGVATDYNPSTSNAAPTGQSHTFSSDFAQGGPLERFIIHVKNQKHQALQFTVQDAYPTGAKAVVGSGRGFSLAGLALQAVTKPGVGKLLANNRSA